VLSEADQLVILTDDMGSAFREVESERGLVSSEVVDVEDEFLWKKLWCAPKNPSYTWVNEAISGTRQYVRINSKLLTYL